MTSRGDVTVREIPPAIAPAVASINALFSCPGASVAASSPSPSILIITNAKTKPNAPFPFLKLYQQ